MHVGIYIYNYIIQLVRYICFKTVVHLLNQVIYRTSITDISKFLCGSKLLVLAGGD